MEAPGGDVRRGRLDTDAAPASGERFSELARLRNVLIESIVSSASPDGAVYRQEQDEWVVLLEGSAELDVDGERVSLTAGDWVLLPAGVPHCVLRTSDGARWLAVHVHPTS
ncbi:MAG TPA: cupin domain-containing protein [Acidimicrobiales bacterium]